MTVIAMPRSTEREDTLRAMLDRYPEARAQAKGEGGMGGRFESALLTFDPLTWTREMRELDRCLTELRRLAQGLSPIIARDVSARKAWWHLSHRYLLCVTTRKTVRTQKHQRTGERRIGRLPAYMEVIARPTLLHGKEASVLVRQWDPGVRMNVVDVAVQWIAGEYRGVPALPEEMVA